MLNRKSLIEVLSKIENSIRSGEGLGYVFVWVIFVNYVVITYVLSLRGPESLLLDLDGIVKYFDRMDQRKILIMNLYGKIKEEDQDRFHLLPCCLVTSSSISVHSWVTKIINIHEKFGRSDCIQISNEAG